MKDDLIKFLDQRKRLYDKFVESINYQCQELVKREMHYAIDILWSMEKIILEDKRELEEVYDCEMCF